MEFDDDLSEGTGLFDVRQLARAAEDEPAQVIGDRYAIVDRIGEGGMGQVLRVAHRRLGKHFALKLMQAESATDPESREIFHREARLASAMSHPNIVSVVDFGEDPDWGLFIVMEYLEGESLAERIDQYGPLPINVVCNVASQLCEALRHSHAHDVVHSDLKAENVLCIQDPNYLRRRWTVKLLDFGMAHLTTMATAEEDRIAGTPEYLAPERITGSPPQPSVDIYALGIIMYEMIAGVVPFTGDTPHEILRRHLSDTPRPLADERGESVDVTLASIVERAMAKDPAARYPTALALLTDLRAYMRELGLRRRSGPLKTVPMAAATRADAAADAFDRLGLACAGLRGDGTIVVANTAFARLVGAELVQLEGANVVETSLAALYPGLREDVRLVAMTGKVARRRLTLRLASGGERRMRLLLNPSSGSSGDCLLALHSIPAAE